MPNAVRAGRLIQVGKESTRGTLVAATRRILADDVTFRRLDAITRHENQMHGTLAPTAIAPDLVRTGSELVVTSELDFEQILLPLLAGIKGGVTPTEPGGAGPAELWTFTPDVAGDPAPNTFTVEFVESDFTDELEYEFGYGFCTEFSIDGGVDQLPTLSYTLMGRGTVESSKTASIALPATSYAGNLAWKAYIDSAWSGLGGTQILGQIYGFGVGVATGIRGEFYNDGRASLDFSQYEFGQRVVDLTLEVAIDPSSGAFLDAEEAAKKAGTRRFVRLELLGAAFGSPDAAFNRMIRLDGAFVHAEDSLVERGSDRDGVATVTAHLISTYDPTEAQDFEISVQNALTAFP